MLPKTALVKKALSTLYDGQATIWTYGDDEPDENGIVAIHAPVSSGPYPCRVSYKSIVPAEQSDGLSVFEQSITLFMSPDVAITAGADVDVTQRGQTLHFTAAGVPAVYDSHQEVTLRVRGKYSG